MNFRNPEQYARYLKEFNYKGCSFSGGEPLLVTDRLIDYLRTIRRMTSPDLYIWMYTNGILARRDTFRRLADEGLNEVRFDIGAMGYSLKAISEAGNSVPVITVEIPAVPEKINLLKSLIPRMSDLGVSNLNLHQLRLTSHNAPKLLRRGYTYLHGEHPTVLESELTALELIKYVDENNLDIGVNYCGFQYKHRFQKAGYRRKIAGRAKKGRMITENGYEVSVFGSEKQLAGGKILSNSNIAERVRKGDLVEIKPPGLERGLKYFNTFVFTFSGADLAVKSAGKGNKNPVSEGLLPGEIFSYTTGPACYPVIIPSEKKMMLIKLLASDGTDIPSDPDLFQIWKYWFIESGLRPYF